MKTARKAPVAVATPSEFSRAPQARSVRAVMTFEISKTERELFDSLDERFSAPELTKLLDGNAAKSNHFLTALLRNRMVRSYGFQTYRKA